MNKTASDSPYNAAITREQFLFYETRITAKIVSEGLNDDVIVDRIVKENLFQYPTEKSVRKMAFACLRRLEALEDDSLVQAIANQPTTAEDLEANLAENCIPMEFMEMDVFDYTLFLDTRRTMMAQYIKDYYRSLD